MKWVECKTSFKLKWVTIHPKVKWVLLGCYRSFEFSSGHVNNRNEILHITLALLSSPIELSSPSPRASYLMANAALAARDLEIFPLSLGAA